MNQAIPETETPSGHQTKTGRKSTTDLLLELGDQVTAERLTIGELIDALQDRAFGFLLLILALPCSIPFLYGVPQAVSLPLIFVAAQIILGRHTLWLPETVKKRSFSASAFRDMTARAAPYVRWFEVLSRPRLVWLTRGTIERLLGLFILIFSISIAIPLPLTNTVPGFAVAIMALGFIERDGLLIIAGTIIGTAWIIILVSLAGGVWILLEQVIEWLS